VTQAVRKQATTTSTSFTSSYRELHLGSRTWPASVTENMRANRIETWKAAWNDSDFRKDVQSMFSKAQARFTSAG
jgi:hypothetical protein